MKKRLLAMLLAVCLLLGTLPMAASAGGFGEDTGTGGEDTTWSFDAATGTLTISGTGTMKNYNWNGYYAPWSEYGDSSCYEQITSIVIEEGITTVGNFAFYGLPNVASVSLPSTLQTIGREAFAMHILNKPQALKAISIPEGVTTIGEYAFRDRSSLQSVSLPTTLKTIGGYAFYNCTSLSDLQLPEGLETIEEEAFYKCSSISNLVFPSTLVSVEYLAFADTAITTVFIPAALTSISGSAFSGCKKLANISVDEQNPNYKSEAGILYSKNGATLECYPLAKPETSFEIPKSVSNVEEIISSTFQKLTNVTSVTVEEGNERLKVIDGILYSTIFGKEHELELMWCPKSVSGKVTIPQAVSEISYNSPNFAYSNISEFEVEEGNERFFTDEGVLYEYFVDIDNNDVYYLVSCPTSKQGNLTLVNKPEMHAYSYALYGCDRITSITFQNQTTEIYNGLIDSCKNLEYVIIPPSVTKILYGGAGNGREDKKRIIIYGEKGSYAETFTTEYPYSYTFRAGLPEDYVLEPDWTKVTAKASVPYGTTNAGMVTIPSTGTATDGETTVSGKFEVLNASTVQLVGNRKVTVQFTVTTDGDYKGTVFTKDYSVTVVPKSISTCTISNISALPYNGSSHSPKPVVKDGNTTLIEGTDYTVLYSNNINVGTAAVTITGEGNYVDAVVKNFTITKAAITGYQTAAPTATILANNTNNTAANLKTAANLPANVTVTYAGGTASLPITWADATEKFNAKGGTYTFKGTVTPGTNFNAYSTSMTATLTVTPVTGTLAAALPTSVVVAKSQAANAASYADFKLPSSITINCDNSVETQTITPEWSVPLNTLKAKRAGTKTVVKVTNVPEWLTMAILNKVPKKSSFLGALPFPDR